MALVQSLRILDRGCGTLATSGLPAEPPASPSWKVILIFFFIFIIVLIRVVWFISFHFGHFSLGVFRCVSLGVFVAMTL